MIRLLFRYLSVALLMAFCLPVAHAEHRHFHVLAFCSTNVEKDHVLFAEQAMKYYAALAKKDEFDFATTSNWDDLNETRLKDVQVVLWLDDFPHTDAQRKGFEEYMNHGGGWLGFHIAAFNDEGTHWPWFVDFLGGTVFYGNSWPPLPALLDVEDHASPVTKGLPATFTSPINEWYIWKPSPRLNKDVKVLLSLDQSNFPLGLKDTIRGGDVPVVWTNTRYRMLYINMGHGEKIFDSPIQNRLFDNALLWLGSTVP
ncbi:ThuA domain-containing protein [Acidicapsa dinghuensis]|uniref:ThuA domain-containing protein n=1 Tax=Acidicapsa dinghuensis TaxID=2218256 RepID=A0ABW1EQ96_9BACT|nr:ThuA domain-containing protein [Acidicapsa dinghuensis]